MGELSTKTGTRRHPHADIEQSHGLQETGSKLGVENSICKLRQPWKPVAFWRSYWRNWDNPMRQANSTSTQAQTCCVFQKPVGVSHSPDFKPKSEVDNWKDRNKYVHTRFQALLNRRKLQKTFWRQHKSYRTIKCLIDYLFMADTI